MEGKREAWGLACAVTLVVGEVKGSPEPPSYPLPPSLERLHLPASPAGAAGREKKKKKNTQSLGQAFPECASCQRGAGGGARAGGGAAGAGRALGRPGPSMAEPLLRKTFSRLRGREKLPRKKSDAKERGE